MAEMNNQQLILMEIKMMERQLRRLRSRVEAMMQPAKEQTGYFGDLYGAWEDAGEISEEEIDEVLYTLPKKLEDI